MAAGDSDAAREIPGHGWVTAEQARAIITAPGSEWRGLGVDARNGGPLHRAHHNLKTARFWSCVPTDDHATTRGLHWRTLAGRDYITFPEDYREALDDPRPPRPPRRPWPPPPDEPPPF